MAPSSSGRSPLRAFVTEGPYWSRRPRAPQAGPRDHEQQTRARPGEAADDDVRLERLEPEPAAVDDRELQSSQGAAREAAESEARPRVLHERRARRTRDVDVDAAWG